MMRLLFYLFLKISVLSNLHLQPGAGNLKPRDEELQTLPAESARHPQLVW